MADKKPYSSIIDALLNEREPDWKGLDLEAEKKSGEEVLDRTHQYADKDFIDEIAESASKHTPVWGPKSGSYEQRIAEKEAAAPRVSAVKADWRKDARRDQDAYSTRMGDNDSLMDEVTMTIEQAGREGNLRENSADKKEVSEAQVQKYVRDLLNQGTAPAKVAAQLRKLAEIELFNHQSATDYLQRNAGLLGLAYLEPNTYMDKNSPTYERTAKHTAAVPLQSLPGDEDEYNLMREEQQDRMATPAEADREWVVNVGRDRPDQAWILSDRDVWHRNPAYSGPPVPHPEEDPDPLFSSDASKKGSAKVAVNLQPVTGKPFYAKCADCGKNFLFGDGMGTDVFQRPQKGEGGFADLDGEAFKAYYCNDCAAKRRTVVNWDDMTPEEKREEAEYQQRGFERNPHHGASSNDCVRQHDAWKNAGVKPQARSVKQVKACEGCSYFRKDASGKQCNLYHLPVVANTVELAQIVNHLTPGVPEKRKHAALVNIANGDDKRVQNTVVASQTNIVKTADAKVSNQGKRSNYEFADNRETTKRFASDHVAKMHEKGASLEQVYKWASGKFGDVDVSIAFRGFVQTLRKDVKGKIVVASKDLEFLNSIGIRNAAFEGGEKCASCPSHKRALMPAVNPLDEPEEAAEIRDCQSCGADPHNFSYQDELDEVFCTSCGEVQPFSVQDFQTYQQSDKFVSRVGRVGSKFASKTPDAVRGQQAEAKKVTVTPAKVRMLHQAGHSVERIYSGAASKVGSVQAKKAVVGFVEDMKKRPGKVAVSEADRAFLIGKLGFKPEQVRMLDPQRRPVTQVVASVPDDVHVIAYPGMGKQAGEKKATDGHSILAEYDLHNAAEMGDIDTSGPKREEIQMNDSFKVDVN
jgi:hypothetical protein